jgi:hypothetical protein
MAAAVTIRRRTGTAAAPTNTDQTSALVRLSAGDTPWPGTAFPVSKPASGFTYTLEAWLFLNCSTAPAGTINNVRVYSDGTIGWTGVTLNAGVTATYPTNGAADTGQTASAYATTSIASYTSGSPLSVALADVRTVDGNFSGRLTRFVVLQGKLGPTADVSAGDETVTWKYDET